MEVLDSVLNSFSPFDIQEEQLIIIKSLDPLRAKKTFIRKKLGHTMVHGFSY